MRKLIHRAATKLNPFVSKATAKISELYDNAVEKVLDVDGNREIHLRADKIKIRYLMKQLASAKFSGLQLDIVRDPLFRHEVSWDHTNRSAELIAELESRGFALEKVNAGIYLMSRVNDEVTPDTPTESSTGEEVQVIEGEIVD